MNIFRPPSPSGGLAEFETTAVEGLCDPVQGFMLYSPFERVLLRLAKKAVDLNPRNENA
jgi:hypothetical protein